METQTELFSITCTSCAAKLKVRHESAIGQVLSCPRCQSMVMVDSPEGWESKKIEQSDAPVTDDSAIVPTGDWNTSTSKQRQKMLILVTCSALLLLVVAVIVVVVASPFGTQSAGNDTEEEVANPLSGDGVDHSDTKENPFVEVENTPGTIGDELEKKPANMGEQSGDSTNGNSASGHDDEPTGTKSKANNNSANDPNSIGSNNTAENSKTSENDISEDAQLNGSTKTKGEDKSTDQGTKKDPEPFGGDSLGDASSSDPLAGPNSILKGLADAGAPIFGADKPVITDDPDATSENEEIGIGSIYVERPDPIEGDINEKLDINLTGFKFDKSVLELVHFLGKMCDAPIGFDIDAIQAEEIDINQQLDIFAEDSTVRQILETSLAPLGLALEIVEGAVVITTVNRSNFDFKNYQWPAAIDSNDNAATSQFTANLKSAINPVTWSENGGQGILEIQDDQLRIFQTPSTHQKIGDFIEQLNIAVQLAESPKDEALIEKSKSKYLRVNKHMNAIPSLEIVDPQPIGSVIEKLAKELNITIVIDWRSLMSEQWNPNTMVTWVHPGKPFGDSLNELMSSMKIGYRWIDTNTLEITTREKIRNALEIEVYSITNLKSENRTHQHIIWLVENNIAPIMPRNNPSSMVYEPKCDAIVALLPQTVHKLLQKLLLDIEKRPAK